MRSYSNKLEKINEELQDHCTNVQMWSPWVEFTPKGDSNTVYKFSYNHWEYVDGFFTYASIYEKNSIFVATVFANINKHKNFNTLNNANKWIYKVLKLYKKKLNVQI